MRRVVPLPARPEDAPTEEQCAELVRKALDTAEAAAAARLRSMGAKEAYDQATSMYLEARSALMKAKAAFREAAHALKRARAECSKARAEVRALAAEIERSYWECRTALRAAHAAWVGGRKGLTDADHERWFQRIAEASGVPLSQVIALAGYRSERGEDEAEEDHARMSRGWTRRWVAMYRGISVSSVQWGAVKSRVSRMLRQFDDLAR